MSPDDPTHEMKKHFTADGTPILAGGDFSPSPVRPLRPSKLEQGILLAARWLVEYGEPGVAADMLRNMGMARMDVRRMEKQDQEPLSRLNRENGIQMICAPIA